MKNHKDCDCIDCLLDREEKCIKNGGHLIIADSCIKCGGNFA